jgi:hypothetical protein
VTGLDNSPEMLARLEAKLKLTTAGHVKQAAPTIMQADMTDFTLPGNFRLALIPYNTFMHLLMPEQQCAALRCVRQHLLPAGVLALDLPNPGEAYAGQEQGLTLERTFKDGERTVQQFSSVALDRAAQLAHVTWLYDSTGLDGALQRTTIPLTMRYTFPAEMSLLLELCGFRLKHLYGDYDYSPFADGAPRMLVAAEAV